MTAALPQSVLKPEPIVAGSMWRELAQGPWPMECALVVKVIDAREGWVRYFLNDLDPDHRVEESTFRAMYEPTYEYAKGRLLVAPVPRDELEGALHDLLSAFYYHTGESNYAVRDAAIRRAQLAIGAKVTL